MKLTKLATIGTLAVSIAGLSACNNMMPAKEATMPAEQAAAQAQQAEQAQVQQAQQAQAQQAATQSEAVAEMNVVQVAQSSPEFSTLVEAVEAAGIAGPLSNPDANLTILAPTNAAFAEALQETGISKEELFANKPALTKILGYHVINGAAPVYAKDVKPGNIMMLSKDTLMVTPEGKLTDESGRTANILQTDIAATNGVVHVIDKVLLPQ